jgi:hypothetical protein
VRYHGALPRSCWRSRVRACRFLPSFAPVLQVSGEGPFEESCGERFALKIVRSVAAELRNGIGTLKPTDYYILFAAAVFLTAINTDLCSLVFLRRESGLAVRASMAPSTHPGSSASGLQRNGTPMRLIFLRPSFQLSEPC